MSARSFRRARQREIERDENRERRLGRRSKAAIAAGAGLGSVVLFAPAADAATFTVSNLDDAGAGSLREAVLDANAAAGADTVAFQAGLTGTITLATGEITIEEALDVQGPGPNVVTVSGDDTSRIFYVNPDVVGEYYDPVTISGLTLTEGFGSSQGGALYSENATLTLNNMVFNDNEGDNGGGAVYSDEGKLFITGSVFTNNRADGEGGAVYVDNTQEDGAIENDVVIQNSTFTNNAATSASGRGGALYLDVEGGVLIENSTFTNNSSVEEGGAVDIEEIEDGNDLTIRNSIFSGNSSSDGQGGGIYVDTGNEVDTQVESSTFTNNSAFYGGAMSFNDNDGDTIIRNSTISGNQAPYDGGGIYFGYIYDGRTTAIRNSTITGNAAGANPGDYVANPYGGGGIYLYDDSEDVTDPIVENGPVEISSSIIANNTGVDFGPDLGNGGFADGFNVASSLIGNPADAKITATGPNLTGVDPQLGPLQDNGGPTQTHAPAFTSPVIDMGIGNGLPTDQRGAPRTFDAVNVANAAGGDGTDIGAVELLPGGRLALAQCKGRAENVLFAPGTPIVGTDANDVIVGTDANDNINSGKGKDKVCAGGGNDAVKASSGKDNVAGQAGKDRIKGNGGNDKLQGNAGRDTLKGGGGKDTLKGGGGKDKLRGGPGRDKLKGGGGKDSEVQ